MNFTGGLPETRCGAGSTVAFTEQLRPQIENVMRYLGIRSVVDAPCGDFNWMARVNLSKYCYYGIDYDPQNLSVARSRSSEPEVFAPRSRIFLELDLTEHAIPSADLVICRDFLQHLPNEDIHRVLNNFRRSGNRWFLITNHTHGDNVDIPERGGFHRVDLTRIPFSLPHPSDSLDDGEGRALCLWSLQDLEKIYA